MEAENAEILGGDVALGMVGAAGAAAADHAPHPIPSEEERQRGMKILRWAIGLRRRTMVLLHVIIYNKNRNKIEWDTLVDIMVYNL